MLHEFLSDNREELAARCRTKVGNRPGRAATEAQLQNGIPMFLDQLIRTLRVEQSPDPIDGELISGPAGGGVALSEVGVSAALHGKELLELGLSVDQVVHDYGDLCQSITDLAVERDIPFEVDEFRTLNRCLDNAISDAVSEFSYQRDILATAQNGVAANEQMGFLVHELRNQLGTASLAFAAAKAGNLSFTGATGTILERSLAGLDKLITNSIQDVRQAEINKATLGAFSLAEFIQEIHDGAALSAKEYGCTFRALPVEAELAVRATRDLLLGAVANLLQNAFKFTAQGTEVLLTAYAQGDRILIDVKDHCGGMPAGVAETMFLPFSQAGEDRTGLGLGLTIAKRTVAASDGTLTVYNLHGVGCVFTINLPRYSVLT